MADVTISQLTKGTPVGSNILPYSTGNNTLGVPVSAIFQNISSGIGINCKPESSETKLFIRSEYPYAYLFGLSGSSKNSAMYLLVDVDNKRQTCLTDSNGSRTLVFDNSVPGQTNTQFWNNNTEAIRINSSNNVGIGTTSPTTKLDTRGLVGTIYTSPVSVPSGTTATVLDPSGDRFTDVYGHFNQWVRSTFSLVEGSFIVQATTIWGVLNATDSAVFLIHYSHGIQSCSIKRMDDGYMKFSGDTFVSGGGPGAGQKPVIRLTHSGTGTVTPKFNVTLIGVPL